MILGFLSEQPQHGYELRRRIEHLHGHAHPVSDGSLYPAIKRLTAKGLVSPRQEVGTAGTGRRVLEITAQGRSVLLGMLRDANGPDITDQSRFLVVLAFLSRLPDAADQAAVLRRRADFLAHPESFFLDDRGPVHRSEVTDRFRQGIFEVARATNRAEQAWLATTLRTLEQCPTRTPDTPRSQEGH